MPENTKISLAEWWNHECRVFKLASSEIRWMEIIWSAGGAIVSGIFALNMGWNNNHDTMVVIVSALVGFAVIFAIQFLIKMFAAPAKMEKELQQKNDSNQKKHIEETRILTERIQSLSDTKENEEKAAFLKKSIREIMANQLVNLEYRISEINNMSGIAYKNIKKDGHDIATNELIEKISSFLKNYVSPDSAILFTSKTGAKYTPVPAAAYPFKDENERYAVIDNLNHFAAQLKEILKNH
jgi:hypothetical protein